MAEQEKTQEGKIHPWVYFIAPLEQVGGWQVLWFTAFCKDCGLYFAEQLVSGNRSSLPKYGCDNSRVNQGQNDINT